MRYQLLGGPDCGEEDLGPSGAIFVKRLGGWYVRSPQMTKSERVVFEWKTNEEIEERGIRLLKQLKEESE